MYATVNPNITISTGKPTSIVATIENGFTVPINATNGELQRNPPMLAVRLFVDTKTPSVAKMSCRMTATRQLQALKSPWLYQLMRLSLLGLSLCLTTSIVSIDISSVAHA